MRRLSEQLVTLRAQLAEQSSTLLDQHPRIKELRAQIADLERQVRGEAERLAIAFENDAKSADDRLQSLRRRSTSSRRPRHRPTSRTSSCARSNARRSRSAICSKSWLAKYREATARDNIGASSPEARIISRGIVSNTPSWPKKMPTVLIASLGMFTLAVGFILTGQLMGGPLPASAAVTAPVARTVEPVVPPPVGCAGGCGSAAVAPARCRAACGDARAAEAGGCRPPVPPGRRPPRRRPPIR